MARKWVRWLHNPCRLGVPHRFAAGGKITPAVWGVPTASERGAESEVAHKWARWLNNPCHLGGPHRFRAGGRFISGPQVGKVAKQPLPPWGVPTASERGAETRGGPQVGKVAT